jgi:hypothetical protein
VSAAAALKVHTSIELTMLPLMLLVLKRSGSSSDVAVALLCEAIFARSLRSPKKQMLKMMHATRSRTMSAAMPISSGENSGGEEVGEGVGGRHCFGLPRAGGQTSQSQGELKTEHLPTCGQDVVLGSP